MKNKIENLILDTDFYKLASIIGLEVDTEKEITHRKLLSDLFPNSPEAFRRDLEKLNNIHKLLLEIWYNLPSDTLDKLMFFEEFLCKLEEYYLKLIRGLNIEQPGFHKQIGLDYIYKYVESSVDRVFWEFSSNYRTKFNEISRFTKKPTKIEDVEFLFDSFEIKNKSLLPDDLIAGWAIEIMKTDNQELKELIINYYSYPKSKVITVKEFKSVIQEIEQKLDVPWESKSKNNPIDIFCDNLDWIEENTLKYNVSKFRPSTLKIIISTLLNNT
jgi:hypothetical protein